MSRSKQTTRPPASRRWWPDVYSEVSADAGREDHAESPARATLLTGVGIGAVLLVTGLATTLLKGEPRPNEPPSIAEMLRGMTSLHGVALVYAGLLVLAITPMLRVCVMVAVYLRHREWFMFAVSVIVLCLLVLALKLGTG
jgi:uncharacterized membrane protein